MLDQLVESKSNRKENKKRGEFLLTTFVLVVGMLFSAVLWSLFAKDLGIGREEFELSTIVAPIPISENAPVLKQERREPPSAAKNETVSRQINMLRVDETQPAPKDISVVPNTQKSRPNGVFLIKDGIEDGVPNLSSGNEGRGNSIDGISVQESQSTQSENVVKIVPPPPPLTLKKSTAETPPKKNAIVSTGVVNGKATVLPKPLYPPTARLVNASGEVTVQVTIDEAGNVTSAKATSGHPLLREVSEKAALNAKFKPTLLSNQPVKVIGVIVYKFSTQ